MMSLQFFAASMYSLLQMVFALTRMTSASVALALSVVTSPNALSLDSSDASNASEIRMSMFPPVSG